MTLRGFPHSDISDSCACTRLVRAFRSVPRPSSALDAKASPVCPSLLRRLSCGEADPLALHSHAVRTVARVFQMRLA